MDTLIRCSATDLAHKIAAKTASSEEVVRAFVDRIERFEPRVRAFVHNRFERALIEARAHDAGKGRLGSLAGVPISIKECFDLEGTASTYGLTNRRAHRAAEDAPVIARLRAAGAIVLGKTNLSQLLLYAEADNPAFGCTNNPWALDRAAGGSSGGEGAALAACFAPLGVGTDIGGSVRVPAHFTGTVAFKPTPRTLPMRGTGELFAYQDDVPDMVGPMARTVADLELALGVMRGEPTPREEKRRLRIGVYEKDGELPPSPAVARAVREAARALEDAGCEIVPFPMHELGETFALLGAFMMRDRARGIMALARGSELDIRNKPFQALPYLPIRGQKALAWFLDRRGQRHYARLARTPIPAGGGGAERNIARRDAIKSALFARMDAAKVDVLLSYPYPTPAILHGASKRMPPVQFDTAFCNVFDMPAGVVPVTRVAAGEEDSGRDQRDIAERVLSESDRGSVGLPVGVQIAGRPFADGTVLAAMRLLETALGDSRPHFAPLD